MPVYQLGTLNTAALQAPNVYVQIIPPKTRYINGVPTDIYGLVGVASWGPINSPTLVGSPADAQRLFGVQQVRKNDLGSALAIAFQVGALNTRVVRVTDSSDLAAAGNLMDVNVTPAIGAVLTAFYTGSVGNSITAAVTAGTKASTYKVSINLPGFVTEQFDNIAGTGATLWGNIVSAINNGQSGLRGPSALVTATRTGAVGVALPNVTSAGVVTLAAGSDGATTITDATLIGTDGLTRTGMYALRGSGASVVNLVDSTGGTTGATWSAMNIYGLSEGAYMVGQGAVSASYTSVSGDLNTAGVDSYAVKVLVGDWVSWQDTVNGQLRTMAPATFMAAKIAAQAPQLSSLNKAISGIVGTQRTAQNYPYSDAEIGGIVQARLDVITNPCPGGSYYGGRTGRNASSNPAVNGDNYTRMTNFIAFTLAASFGWVIGELQTKDLRRTAKSTMESFLSNLEQQGMIGDVNGGPAYAVQLDAANNPDSRVALGYMQADVQVKYLSVIFDFIVNLEGGQSVSIQSSIRP
jgi:uncharacterized protein